MIPAILVVSAVGTYTLLKAFYPLRWYFEDSGLSGTGWVGENKEDKMSKTGEKPGKGTYLFFALQPFAGE